MSEDPRDDSTYKSVVYFTNWSIYQRKYNIQCLPVKLLTHVLYSFADTSPESGTVFLTDQWADTQCHFDGDRWYEQGSNVYGCVKQLYLLKKAFRNIKTLLSIGGWTYSKNLHPVMLSEVLRTEFVRSASTLMYDLGFDGIDIDYEYPMTDEHANGFQLLLRAMRDELDHRIDCQSQLPRFLLTIASPAAQSHIARLYIKEMDVNVDAWHLMTYDFAGPWDTVVRHHANLYGSPPEVPHSAHDTARAYISAGVNPRKIILGMPLYGRTFSNTTGLGSAFAGAGYGSWEPGVIDYKDIVALPNIDEQIDEQRVASWKFDPANKTFISYDSCRVAEMKAEYIIKEGLGGVFWWESSADTHGDSSLIETTVDELGGQAKLELEPNRISYPYSSYDNIRRKMEPVSE